MSSTKPEVHNLLLCRQRKTEPRPRVGLTRTENFVKLGHVVFETCERTDRQTDTLIATLCTPTVGKVIRSFTTTLPITCSSGIYLCKCSKYRSFAVIAVRLIVNGVSTVFHRKEFPTCYECVKNSFRAKRCRRYSSRVKS